MARPYTIMATELADFNFREWLFFQLTHQFFDMAVMLFEGFREVVAVRASF